MTQSDFTDESSKRMQDIDKRLPWHRLRVENYEVDWMAFMQSHADFGVMLETSDTRSVPCAWIDNDNRGLFRINTVFPTILANFRDPQKRVI